MKKRFWFFLILAVSQFCSYAQPPAQTIRGRIIDSETGASLPGATIVLEGTDPLNGTSSDLNGNFRIEKVPVGRYDIVVRFVGYEPLWMREIVVGSVKEVFLDARLKESIEQMEVVEIIASQDKDKPLNSMATVSARQISVEEARRYAGSVDDPAQLVQSFAGVAGGMSGNAIIVRGNAPKGILWQMEGVQISNPNHYANVINFGGGAFTALSAQLLANSDFYTGAWPAEYGNGLSGVFDIRMRTGNNEKHEHAVQLGTLGIDLASEGPFKKGGQSSYLFNYRFSSFVLLAPLLPDDAAGNRFQDLSFKMNFPLKKGGVLSWWGIGAWDISGLEPNDPDDRQYAQDLQDLSNRQYMGATGLNYRKVLGNSAYLNSSLSVSGNGIQWNQRQLDEYDVLQEDQYIVNDQFKIAFSTYINKKLSARHTLRSGATLSNVFYRVDIRNAETPGAPLHPISKSDGNSYLLQGYAQSKYAFNNLLTMNLGAYLQHFTLNGSLTFEPRIGLNYQFLPQHSIGLGVSNHSMMEMLQIYFITRDEDGKTVFPNKELTPGRANHFVLSYKWNINEFTHFTAEPYYQYLYNIPVIDSSSFSMLNLDMDWFIDEKLINTGKGDNFGIDLTLEQFMRRGFYYLVSGSLFQSKYEGGDGIRRDSRFNKGYVVNLLAGKEWSVGKMNKNQLSLNGRFVVMGGDRISPVDEAASHIAKDVVYDEIHAFANQKPDNYHLHLGFNYRKNNLKFASIWSVQLVNILGSEEFYGYKYNLKTNQIDEDKERLLFPQISYKIEF